MFGLWDLRFELRILDFNGSQTKAKNPYLLGTNALLNVAPGRRMPMTGVGVYCVFSTC